MINTGGRNCDSILKEIYNQAMVGGNTRREDSNLKDLRKWDNLDEILKGVE